MLLCHVTWTLCLLQANAESHVEIQISDDSRHAHFDFHRCAAEYTSYHAISVPCMLFADSSLLCAYNLTAKFAPCSVSVSIDFSQNLICCPVASAKLLHDCALA